GDPFARIARLSDGEREAAYAWRIEPIEHRVDGGREFRAGDHMVHARQCERRRGVDLEYACRCVRRGHDRHMQHAVALDVGNETSPPDDETPVFAHAAVGRDELEWCLVHVTGSMFDPASRRAASSIASTICP